MANDKKWLMFFIRAAFCGSRCKHCDFAVTAQYPLVPVNTIKKWLGPFILERGGRAAAYGNISSVLSDSPLNYPELPEYVRFLKEHGVEGYLSLAANGFRLRTAGEWEPYLKSIRQAGTEYLEFTFYGDKGVHDLFAGRKGDFEAIHALAAQWRSLGGKVAALGCMVHKKNIDSLAGFRRSIFEAYGVPCDVSLWGYLGHAAKQEDLRIDEGDLSKLDEEAVLCLGDVKSERQWVRELTGSTEKPYSADPKIMRIAIDHDGNAGIPYTTPGSGLAGLTFDKLPTVSAARSIDRWNTVYAEWLRSLPAVGDLAKSYGDITSSKLHDYSSIKNKWIQMSVR